jgi:hypothetical protein
LYGYIGHSAWAGGLAVVVWYPISALASYLFSGRFDPAPPKSDKSSALISDVRALNRFYRTVSLHLHVFLFFNLSFDFLAFVEPEGDQVPWLGGDYYEQDS